MPTSLYVGPMSIKMFAPEVDEAPLYWWTSTLDCDGDFVVFGVLDCGDDILVVVRVHDQGRMHVMVEFVSGGSILVVVVLVGLGFDCAFCCAEVLFAAEALDGSHGRSTVMWLGMASGSRCMIVGR